MRGFGEIFQVLTMVLPPWALVILAVLLAAWMLPAWRTRIRAKQVREAVRRLVRCEPHQRDAFVARALDRADGDPYLLSLLASEAWKRSMPLLRDEAVRRLEAHPRGAADLARIRREQYPQAPAPMHPLEVAVRVRQLLDEELVEAARLRLAEGLAHSPGHPDLEALRVRVEDHAKPARPLDSGDLER